MDKNLTFLAKTFYGFEPLLEKELRSLGAREIKPGNRLVTFKGDLGFLYKANLALRTALKILMPIHRFAAADEEMLYQAIYRFPWEDYLSHEQPFALCDTENQRCDCGPFSKAIWKAPISRHPTT
jgi:putative N6-adenine-specific DNA methylase